MNALSTRCAVYLLLPLLTACMPDLESLRGRPEDGGLHIVSGSSIEPGKADDPARDGGTAYEGGVWDDGGLHGDGNSLHPPPAPRCGVPGTPCCREGTGAACAIGACLRGRCEAFAGLWARSEPLACTPGGCALRNPYTAGCSCPEGFEAWEFDELRGPCDAEGGTDGAFSLRLCLGSGRLGTSAFGGMWLRTGADCLVPDPWTGDCRCPEGSEPLETTAALADGRDARIGLCIGPGFGEESFAGAYLLGPEGPGGCTSPNPWTGRCQCPAGSEAQWVPLRASGGVPHPLALCLRSGARP